jgi:two-component system response regulator YesN
MYKILLADDEQIVLDSLQFIFSQQYGDRCQVSVARSGREAITHAEAQHPDLAIMDINMPGINGIEAIRTIRDLSPGTQFILLTAFDKFDYAKQAINLGVLDYLTKPFNRKRIVEAVDAAFSRVDAARRRWISELEMREKLENVRSILETGFFYSFLFAADQQAETARYLDLLDIPSPTGLVLALEFGDKTGEDDQSSRIGLNVRVNRDYPVIRDLVKMLIPCLVGPLILNRIAVFVPLETSAPFGPDSTADWGRQLFDRLPRELGAELRVGVSRAVESVSQLHDAYQECLLALRMTPVGQIGHYAELLPSLGQRSNSPLDWLESSFLQALRQGDAEMASHLFAQLLGSLDQDLASDLPKAQAKGVEWLALASRQTERPSQGLSVAVDYASLLGAATPEEFRNRATEQFRDIALQLSGTRGRPLNDLISQARQYIADHFTGQISLESVAESIALSPPYFSRLFSSQVGKTFIDYLTELRIAKASQLLRDSQLSIKEICSAVGYSDPNYFSRIFKKVTGRTPSEFRL